MKPKAFMLYANNRTFIDRLDDDQAGQVFKAIFRFADTGEEPEQGEMDQCSDIVFQMFKIHIEQAMDKYADACRKRSEAGRKGGLAKASNARNTQANLSNNKNNNKKKKWVGIDE